MFFASITRVLKSQNKGNSAFERSVDSLQGIYAIIVALSITKSIEKLFECTPAPVSIFDKSIISNIPILLAFFVTVVPFFHGMNRYLDKAYLLNKTKNQGFLLFDFFIFCLEAIILVIFSIRYKNNLEGFYLLGILLLVDLIWGILAHCLHFKKGNNGVGYWFIINLATIILGCIIINHIIPPFQNYFLCGLAILRTVTDYLINWKFYFPKEQD